MKTSDFFYELPLELIAQDPIADRSASRLLCLNRQTGALQHARFFDLPSLLTEKDCLVLNDTRVLPARLYGIKKETGARIEVLLLQREENDHWETLVRPGKKCRPGTELLFYHGEERDEPLLTGTVTDLLEDGKRRIHFSYAGIFEEVLDALGEMPLPPYITHPLEDRERYQTVYASIDGSAAAPTAGLHFTEALLWQIREQGTAIAKITLHVGLGTFRPVKAEDICDHTMHREWYEISEQAAETINRTKKQGGRVICVGTTSCRTLETAAEEDGTLRAQSGWTEIFLYPGYSFRIMDGLITNFHLPESTLLMLVSAFAGREQVLAAYQEAIRLRYRFFSFGDAMFIV